MLSHLPSNKKIVIVGEGKLGKVIADFLISGGVEEFIAEGCLLVDDGYRKKESYRGIHIREMSEFVGNEKLDQFVFLNTVTSIESETYKKHLSDYGIMDVVECNDINMVMEIEAQYWLDYFQKNGIETDKKELCINDFVFPNPFLQDVPKTVLHAFLTDVKDLIIPLWKDDYEFCDDGPYETEHVRVSEGDIVIDCGANIGISTANAVARKCKKVYAIEPVMNKSLVNCKELFGDRMEICQVAVSDYEGSATIHINPDSCNDNSIYHVQNTLREELEVEVTTIDSLCERMGLQDIGYMKFCIDDLEGGMIAGARETIKAYKPKIAIFPYCPGNADVFKNKLETLIRGMDSSYVFEYAYNKMFAYTV